MADSRSRNSADVVNIIPLTYDDNTVSEQANRPRRGDLWFREQPLPFEVTEIPKKNRVALPSKKPLKVVRPGRSLRRIESVSPVIRKLPSRKA